MVFVAQKTLISAIEKSSISTGRMPKVLTVAIHFSWHSCPVLLAPLISAHFLFMGTISIREYVFIGWIVAGEISFHYHGPLVLPVWRRGAFCCAPLGGIPAVLLL